jgi:hypothetical protein
MTGKQQDEMDFGTVPGGFSSTDGACQRPGNPATVPLHNCFFGLRFTGF